MNEEFSHIVDIIDKAIEKENQKEETYLINSDTKEKVYDISLISSLEEFGNFEFVKTKAYDKDIDGDIDEQILKKVFKTDDDEELKRIITENYKEIVRLFIAVHNKTHFQTRKKAFQELKDIENISIVIKGTKDVAKLNDEYSESTLKKKLSATIFRYKKNNSEKNKEDIINIFVQLKKNNADYKPKENTKVLEFYNDYINEIEERLGGGG